MNVRVNPCTNAVVNWNVPPTPLIVIGKSSVLPFVVMFLGVTFVLANVRIFALLAMVPPVDGMI